MNTLVRISILAGLFFYSVSAKTQNFYKEKISRDQILSIGLGPSFAYLDNGGQYRSFNFEIKPSAALSYIKKLTNSFELRATSGFQSISSGGNPPGLITDFWASQGSSFTVIGQVIYVDLMPSLYLFSVDNHMNRPSVNLYGGIGFGVKHLITKQSKSFNMEAPIVKSNMTTSYIPVRSGLSWRVGPYSDLAGEGTMILTFSDNLDGNVGSNRFGDHLFQAQLVFRRYFPPRK